ncbi:MAG: hypothetical protein U0939_01210 [Pirellulales bacterium]
MKLSEVLGLDVKQLEKKNEKRRADLRNRIQAVKDSGKEKITGGPNKDLVLQDAEKTFWDNAVKELDKIGKELPRTLRGKSFTELGRQVLQIAQAVDDKLKGVEQSLRTSKTQTQTQTQNQPVPQTTTTPTLDANLRDALSQRVDALKLFQDAEDALRSIQQILTAAKSDDELKRAEKWLVKLEENYKDHFPDPTSDLGKDMAACKVLLKEYDNLKNAIAKAKQDYPSRFSAIVARESALKQASQIVGAKETGMSEKALTTVREELAELKKLLERPTIPKKDDFEGCQTHLDEINTQVGHVRSLPLKLAQLMKDEKDLGEVLSVVGKEVQGAIAPLASFTKIIAETIPFYANPTPDDESKIARNVDAAKKALVACRDALTKQSLFTNWAAIPSSLHSDPNLASTIGDRLNDIEQVLG